VIALGVFFPMAINTYTGVRQAHPLLIRAAVLFGARRFSVIRKVVLHAGNIMATTKLMVGIVVLSLLGILSHRGLGRLERAAIPWRR
jgi:NitT/TauT family transport system permease protein